MMEQSSIKEFAMNVFRLLPRYLAAGTLAVAASFAVPVALASSANGATSASSTLRGVVIARSASRHTIALSVGRSIRTLRLSSATAVNALPLGTNLTATASSLADGTFRVSTLARRGASRHAHVRATIVSTSAHQLTLSSGGSVFRVTSTSRLHAHDTATNGTNPGDVVDVEVSISDTGLDATSLQQVGTTNLIQLDGTLTSVSSTSLVLAVDEGAATTITVPASVTLPSAIVAGDKVEVLVDYASATFTLVTIHDDSAFSNSSGVSTSEDGASGVVHVEGLVVAANATTLTIQPGDAAAPVVLSVPSGVDVSTLSVGARVHARGTLVGGVLTLTSFEVQGNEGDQGASMNTEVEGLVVAVSATSLEIQPGDQATPVTFVVPSTVNVSSITTGARVHARGALVGGVLTLSSVRVQGHEDSGDAGVTQVDGTVSAVSATSLTVQPSDASTPVVVAVPTSVNVSTLQVGSEIHATATLVNGVLTLTNFESRQGESSTVELSGVVAAVSATSLTVLAGDASKSVVLVVPAGVDVSSLKVNDHVDVRATTLNGVLTVSRVSLND
jgi:hypothetical protein